jgi:tetratricopeptide (TPR) repeat protein
MASRRTLLAVPAAGLLSSCAAWLPPPQSAALLAAPPARLPARVELDAVPFFPQTPFHCGPAALATVLQHAGFAQATPETLAEQVFLPAREGALQLEMLAAARRAGALPVRLPGELAALCDELAAGQPMVVLQNLGLAIAPRWHYAVPVGYDLGAREWVLRSGTTRRERLDFGLFERTWARGGHWAFAASVPGRLPPTAREADAIEAALGFDRASPPAASRAAVWDSVAARWPDNLAASIGLGNARATLGDWRTAEQVFKAAATKHDSAAAWHNLALVQAQLGQRDAARVSAGRALDRATAAEPAWREAAMALVEQMRAP